jgi:hypothetical protein
MSVKAPNITQADKAKPIGARILPPVCKLQINNPIAMLSDNAPISGLPALKTFALFHGKTAPKGKKIAKITINGVNAISKNGAPTDSFLPNINSAIKGHIVPMKTTIVETTSSKLFKIRPLSRLMGLNTALERKLFALNAYKDNAPPIAIISISNIKTPRSGSFANA